MDIKVAERTARTITTVREELSRTHHLLEGPERDVLHESALSVTHGRLRALTAALAISNRSTQHPEAAEAARLVRAPLQNAEAAVQELLDQFARKRLGDPDLHVMPISAGSEAAIRHEKALAAVDEAWQVAPGAAERLRTQATLERFAQEQRTRGQGEWQEVTDRLARL